MSNKAEDGAMKAAEKRGRVPKLRFPEFREAADWDVIPLSQLAKRSTKKNSHGKLNRVLTNSAEFGVVDQRDYFDKDIANQGNLEGYFVVEKGVYVYNPRISTTAPVGPISKNNIATGVMSPLYTVFRFNNSHNDFYAHYFKTTGWHQYMRQASSTGARHDRMAITNDDFMAMPLPIASPEEQQKIADCLAALDELITLDAQKLDTLKTHKRGLMQRLFPAEGETLPKLRFPEFRDAGEWEKCLLSQVIVEISNGLNLEQTTDASGFKVTRIETISNNTIDESKVGFVNTDQDISRYRLNIGDILFSNINSLSHIGRTVIVDRDYDIYHGMNLLRLVVSSGSNNAEFVFYLLNTDWVRSSIKARANKAVNQASINQTELGRTPIITPKRGEQQKIADCLASLDDLITTQTQKLAALKTHKKGLMQQLFPALDEVQG